MKSNVTPSTDVDNPTGLRRSLTLTAVIAMGIHGVIGQGIFLVPGKAAGMLGPSSLIALLLGGFLCFLIALCFAEVSSRFDETGGAYVYARSAFGEFIGFEVGWMTCCVAVISWAALANGLTVVLAHFIPSIGVGWTQKAVAIGIMTGLVMVNLAGARQGALISTIFSIAKLIPLFIFIVVGVFFVSAENFVPFTPQGWSGIGETTMLLLYAYVGFETLVVPAGEMQNPQRSVPLALMTVMSIVTVVYALILTVSIGTFAEIAGHGNPVAAASREFMGPIGGGLIALGIVISVFGTNAGAAFVSPRRFFAMAERGDLPAIFARVNPGNGAPTSAIILTWALSAILCLSGSFTELAVLGVVARFLQYIPTCVAVLVFRRRAQDEHPDGKLSGFRMPFGPVIPLAAIGLCVWLLSTTAPDRLLKGGFALLLGVPLFFLSRRARRSSEEREV